MVELVRSKLGAIADLCRKYKVERLFLIGSATGPEFNDTQSDVDFLVVFQPHERRGFDDVYFLLLRDLEAMFGRPIDLIEAHTLRNPYMIASVNRNKQMLYAA
jgi:predicted nucleotidyltransferase